MRHTHTQPSVPLNPAPLCAVPCCIQIKALQDQISALQATCDGLERQRQALQRALRDAEVTAEARRAAERRGAELEGAIAAMRDRARQMFNDLQRQRWVQG